MTIRVLLVDDDAGLRDYVGRYLTHAGMIVATAEDGPEALGRLARGTYDAILLDVGLPDEDGFTLLPRVRALTPAPIVMLTARTDESDRVRGLDAGADDYVAKPFSPRELSARIRAIVRRAGRAPERAVWDLGALHIDLATREVTRAGEVVRLTGVELELLGAFLRHAERVVSRVELQHLMGRGDTVVSERTLDVHIHHLRRKLGLTEATGTVPRLETVRGVGYVFVTGGAA